MVRSAVENNQACETGISQACHIWTTRPNPLMPEHSGSFGMP